MKTKQLTDGLNEKKEDDTRVADRKRRLRKDYRILEETTEFEWLKNVSHITAPFERRPNQDTNGNDRYMMFGNRKNTKQLIEYSKNKNKYYLCGNLRIGSHISSSGRNLAQRTLPTDRKTNPTYETKMVHQEWEYQSISRRYTRYRKARGSAINRLKAQDNGDGRLYDWQTIHKMVLKQREEEGYDSSGIE